MSASRTCPLCKRPISEGEATDRFKPFCSKRCADIDLGRWLKGAYAIPAVEAEEPDSEPGKEEIVDEDAPPPSRH